MTISTVGFTATQLASVGITPQLIAAKNAMNAAAAASQAAGLAADTPAAQMAANAFARAQQKSEAAAARQAASMAARQAAIPATTAASTFLATAAPQSAPALSAPSVMTALNTGAAQTISPPMTTVQAITTALPVTTIVNGAQSGTAGAGLSNSLQPPLTAGLSAPSISPAVLIALAAVAWFTLK